MITLLLLFADAAATPACVAADVCPLHADPCLIVAPYEVGDGCVLDFGPRAVEVSIGGSLDANGGRFAVRGRSFILRALGRLALLDGGAVQVRTTGTTRLEGQVEMWSAGVPSAMELEADSVWVMAPILAYGSTDLAPGGAVTILGTTQVILEDIIDLHGGMAAAGGSLDVWSEGPFSPAVLLDACGGRVGGRVEIYGESTGMIDVGSVLDVSGSAPGADGGTITVTTTGRAHLNGRLRANAGEGGGVSGRGGTIRAASQRADLWLGARTTARGGAPDGDGGAVNVRAATDVHMGGWVDVVGAGLGARGGSVTIRAGGDVEPAGQLRTYGGLGGGVIDIVAGGTVTLVADVDAGGRGTDADGGAISITGRTLDVQSGRVRAEARGTGGGGQIGLQACDLWVQEPAVVYAVGGGGSNRLTSRTSMSVDGDLLADGENILTWRGAAPRIGPTAQIDTPATIAEDLALAACPAP